MQGDPDIALRKDRALRVLRVPIILLYEPTRGENLCQGTLPHPAKYFQATWSQWPWLEGRAYSYRYVTHFLGLR